MRALLGLLMLLLPPTAAVAAGMQVEVAFPAAFAAAPEGSGDVALQVEDARPAMALGTSVDGEVLTPAGELAASLYALVAADLKQAGFNVVPYTAGSPRGLVIRINRLDYKAEKGSLKTSAEVKATLEVDMEGVESTYTFRAHVSDEYAWKPTVAKRGALIGEALASAVQAAFDEPDIVKALTGR